MIENEMSVGIFLFWMLAWARKANNRGEGDYGITPYGLYSPQIYKNIDRRQTGVPFSLEVVADAKS
jgi:hypothetical protein